MIFCTLTYSQSTNKTLCFRDSIDVINYEINLKIGSFSNQNINGDAVIKLTPIFDNTKEIKLDLLGLNVDNVKVNDVIHSNFSYKNDIISIRLQNKINTSDTIQVKVCYNGKPVKDSYWGGFYFSPKCTFNMGVGMASNPPCFGRVWFPCIDNFTDKATYDFNITVKDGLTAVCGGNFISETKNNDNTVTFSWKLMEPIPTYLASVAVGNYELVSMNLNGYQTVIPFQTYVYTGNSEKAKKTFANIEKALKIFELKFGNYQWSRIGFVETSFTSGAMEHATNISLPYYAIDGTLKSEMLIAHEFSHNWFGNLVTCETAENMWLNEGLASYSEAIFIENMYGYDSYKEYVRANQFNVLTKTHLYDGGYYSIYGIPSEITYGRTVYDKGASVSHCLRNYLGDDLFFSAIKQYFSSFKFSTANTYQFKDSLSYYSGIDLTDFFDFYVFEEGFNHFSVESFSSEKVDNIYNVNVKVQQKLVEADFFAKSNKIELTFVDNNWHFTTKTIEFSGEFGASTYILDFKPEFILIDKEEKISDATTDCYKIINENGITDFENVLFSTEINSIKDSVFVSAQCNFVEADNLILNGYKLANNQYWTINMISENNKITGNFYFKTDNYISTFFNNNSSKEKTILYRKSKNDKWEIPEFKLENEYIEVQNLKSGDYIIAIKE